MNTAENVLDRYWDGSLTVDPFKIAVDMGIELRTLCKEDIQNFSGYYLYNNGNPIIFFNPHEASVRQRFTVAHELGHHIHGDISAPRDAIFDANSYSPTEAAANRFAAQLLMPNEILNFVITRQRISSISALAELFGVSLSAMTYRLKSLGYISK